MHVDPPTPPHTHTRAQQAGHVRHEAGSARCWCCTRRTTPTTEEHTRTATGGAKRLSQVNGASRGIGPPCPACTSHPTPSGSVVAGMGWQGQWTNEQAQPRTFTLLPPTRTYVAAVDREHDLVHCENVELGRRGKPASLKATQHNTQHSAATTTWASLHARTPQQAHLSYSPHYLSCPTAHRSVVVLAAAWTRELGEEERVEHMARSSHILPSVLCSGSLPLMPCQE
mgnify:CR=1 FL=1